MFNDNDRGQVGIGTLIVFIAMVLVAAIAAGVLINTAGLLQSQAEATGEESSEQVSDRVVISTVTGTVADPADDGIELINLTVQRSPGAGDINLNDSIVEVFSNGTSDTLTAGDDAFADTDSDSAAPEDAGEFGVNKIQGEDDATLSDSGDRAQLIVDLSDIDEDDSPLQPGQSVSVTVTTSAGGSAFVEKRAPSSFDDEETVRL